MLSRDLRSQASPLCPGEESQMAKIRSPLTPQGEEVKITARMEAHNTMIAPKPQTHYLNKESVVTPGLWCT